MSFKRFDTEDIVISADSITAPAWSGNAPTLTSFFTASSQISATGDYYYNIYDKNPETDNTAAIQFSLAYGHRTGLGSVRYDNNIAGKSYSSTIYGQFRTLITGDENTDFIINGTTPDDMFFISVQRARFKEKILPGSLTLKLKGASEVSLTDNSLLVSTDTFVDSGRVYSIYAGAAGSVSSTNVEYGKLYPDIGVIALSGKALEDNGFLPTLSEAIDGTADNISLFYNSLKTPTAPTFTLRSEETLTSNYVFVRARNSEFNYSTNPSNITGSGELQHDIMIDSPQAYITTVGLYNDNNDLLAVSKLSTPLLKDFTKEALIRIKLDY